MSNTQYDDADLDVGMSSDGELHTQLERVNFEPGILLGVEATRREQDYHRRRLNRHRYWLHGSGTLVGLAVTLSSTDNGDPTSAQPVRLNISPGVGMDGLGREVLCHEPYCLDLRAWLQAQWEGTESPAVLADGLSDDGKHLHLQITMRYASCPSGLQPVMARKVNAGTDPVAPSRQKDSVQFDLIGGAVPGAAAQFWPWGGHDPQADADRQPLSEAEQNHLLGLDEADRARANLAGHLIYALPHHDRALDLNRDPEIVARTLLAEVRIDLHEDNTPHIHPDHIQVNNLVRPIVHSADQLAWLNGHD
jgi:hypothetical protein